VTIRLHTTIASPERDWTAVFIPDEVLGVKRRVWIEGTLNGKPFKATANPMGGYHAAVINRKMRAELGVRPGDEVDLEFTFSTEAPPEAPLAGDIEAALDVSPEARTVFDSLPPSHRRRYVEHIEDAQRPATRRARIEAMVAAMAPD
jgi:hypothetical protein